MAANYWKSTQFTRWLVRDRRDLWRALSADAPRLSRLDVQRLRFYFVEVIVALCKALGLRNRVALTAIVFFKRFYTKCSFSEHDPRLIAPTVLFMAAKAEECLVNASKLAQQLTALPNFQSIEQQQILQLEFICLEVLEFDLCVYHPHRDLVTFAHDAGMQDMLQMAWSIVNDAYRADVCMTAPPFLIAVAALQMACHFRERPWKPWLAELNVEPSEVFEVVRDLLDYYDLQEALGRLGPLERVLAKLPPLPAPLALAAVFPIGASAQLAIAASASASAVAAAGLAVPPQQQQQPQQPPPQPQQQQQQQPQVQQAAAEAAGAMSMAMVDEVAAIDAQQPRASGGLPV